MYWITSESQPPPPQPPTFVEERIPIIARRRSSGEVEVLRWCSRARPTNTNTTNTTSTTTNTTTNTTTGFSSRPLNSSPLSSHSHTVHDSEGESAAQRNLSLPWTNHRLLPEYPVLVSPSWSTTSSSESSSSSSVSGDNYGTFTHNTFNDSADDRNDNDNDNDDEGEDKDNNGEGGKDNLSTHPSETETTPLLPPTDTDPPVTWLSLPHKSQLIVLALCRLSEPLTQSSVSSYLYYLLASFHPPDLPPQSAATISRQAGILASSFALSQCLTGVLWGRLSDRIGRKPCILLGLAGTTISAIGFGFSESLAAALFWRVLGGALNGNVGVLRTMMTETMVEKKYQSRAFLIMPMCSNIGIIIGPMLGGLLADPAGSWPEVWGGVGWVVRWKWALPNVVSAGFLAASWLAGFLFLRETLERRRGRDVGIEVRRCMGRWLRQVFGGLKGKQPAVRASDDFKGDYEALGNHSLDTHDEESALPSSSSSITLTKPVHTIPTAPTPFRDIFTPNIITTLISFAIIPLHNSTFIHLWSIFLSTPRSLIPPTSILGFTGGLGLPAHQVGIAMSYLGAIGILFQVLFYPPIQARFGLLQTFRWACCVFPLAYILMPFLSRLPSTTPAPEPADGTIVWAGIAAVLLLQVAARTFALPGGVILLTNSVESREVLGSVHGVAISLAGASRAVGPALGGLVYAVGLEGGMVGCVFWSMACVAAVGAGSTVFVKEGKGIGGEASEEEGVGGGGVKPGKGV